MLYIQKTHQDGRVNAFYSSPSRYLKALHDAKLSWEVKKDDFFPYAHCEHCYWTGYFTSRPSLKGYIRDSNNVLQACKQIEVLAESGDKAKRWCIDSFLPSLCFSYWYRSFRIFLCLFVLCLHKYYVMFLLKFYCYYAVIGGKKSYIGTFCHL